MSQLLSRLQDELMIRSTATLQVLHAMAPKFAAAEALEKRLKEAGITAGACGHIDQDGCAVAVFVTGVVDEVTRILDHLAIPYGPTANHDGAGRLIRTFHANVMNREVAVVICQTADHAANSRAA